MMQHKGYTGVLEVDDEAGILFGRVIDLRDVITFQGRTVEEARRSFEESVDFYLQSCIEDGAEPDKPFSGKILIRTDPEIHRALAVKATQRGESLNKVVDQALRREVQDIVRPVKRASHKAVSKRPAKQVPKS